MRGKRDALFEDLHVGQTFYWQRKRYRKISDDYTVTHNAEDDAGNGEWFSADTIVSVDW